MLVMAIQTTAASPSSPTEPSNPQSANNTPEKQSSASWGALSDTNQRLLKSSETGDFDGILAALEDGANPRVVNKKGRTPQMNAAMADCPQGVETLLPLSDPHARDACLNTALIWAAFAKSSDCIRFLAPVSEIDAADDEGKTAVIWATQKDDTESVRILAPLSSLRLSYKFVATALYYAAARGNAESARMILSGSDLSATNVRRVHPLQVAALNKDPACLKFLLPHSDPRCLNEIGESAFDWALEHERWGAVDLLAEHAPIKDAEAAFEKGGPEKMPQWAARLEARALRDAAGLTPRNGPIENSAEGGQKRIAISELGANPEAAAPDARAARRPPRSL